MRDDHLEFRFFGIRGSASGRFAIVVLAGLLIVAMIVALLVFRF